MVKKSQITSGTTCEVTFELPAEVAGETAHLCGDFNGWSLTDTPMTRGADGRFSATLALEVGRSYTYRYLVDGERWENDWTADEYVQNPFGGHDSVVQL